MCNSFVLKELCFAFAHLRAHARARAPQMRRHASIFPGRNGRQASFLPTSSDFNSFHTPNMDSKFCQEALNWILREIPGRVFLLTLTASPELKHALTRGGFSISERNFRKDTTKRRILGTFNRRPDLAVSFLDKISTILRKDELVRNEVFKSPVDYKVMEEEWRTKLAETDEPRRTLLLQGQPPSAPGPARDAASEICALLLEYGKARREAGGRTRRGGQGGACAHTPWGGRPGVKRPGAPCGRNRTDVHGMGL